MVDATTPATQPLLSELFGLLAAHRPAFGQDRPYQRAVALVLGWLSGFGRHTLTQVLLALGLGEADWTAWYRLFSRRRFDYDRLSACLLAQTLALSDPTQPYLVAVDATRIARHSRTMPGTSWWHHPATAVFRRGLHRAQRVVPLMWLPLPTASGYSRAVPVRCESAFPPKAVPALGHPPRAEWAAGLAALDWTRQQLDAQGRAAQRVLGLGDGSYSTAKLWADLPARVEVLARCAKNRALYVLPGPYPGRGRRRVYGDRAPRPDAWLAARRGWRQARLAVRGRTIPVTYRVEGPYLVRGAPQRPLFLLVVKGIDQRPRPHRRRPPSFWLVSAVAAGQGGWRVPWAAEQLLGWAWQRWEVEVAHRELKSSFGLGEPQCWSAQGAIRSVQWTVWAYAVLVLAGVRAWGLGRGPVRPPGRWWAGGGRWSLARLWQGYRQELWGETAFHPVFPGISGNWPEMADWLALKTNATLAASRT
jgi:hypothetical protein